MKVDLNVLMAITIAYPILAACATVGAGIYLADAIERHDPSRLLMVATFGLMAIRFSLLAVSLAPAPAIIDRYLAQSIAGAIDSAAAVLVAPYVGIVVYRRWKRRPQPQEAGQC